MDEHKDHEQLPVDEQVMLLEEFVAAVRWNLKEFRKDARMFLADHMYSASEWMALLNSFVRDGSLRLTVLSDTEGETEMQTGEET